jgi:NADH-quinone oxidoreductase subunit H
MVLTYGSIDLNSMVVFQSQTFLGFIPAWGIVIQPLAAIIFIVTAFAETNRAPFDAAEGESEIVAGYHTEYGAMKFGLFFVAEYIAMAASGALIVTMLLGGYQLPWIGTQDLINHLDVVIMILLVVIPLFSVIFLRWMHKNNTLDASGIRETKVYTKIIIAKTVLFELFLLYGLLTPLDVTSTAVGVMVLQIGIFTAKLFMLHFIFVWVRWTVLRFRYDQTLDLGWNILLPLSIANVIVTAIVIVAFNL